MSGEDAEIAAQAQRPGSAAEVFRAFLALGLTSFGRPIAHLGYFHEAFVVRRKWIGEAAYADLVALCQFLPGPASSQVGMAIEARPLRAMPACWPPGWPSPCPRRSCLLLSPGVRPRSIPKPAAGSRGRKAAAVAVVAQAVLAMASSLAPDRERATVAVAAMIGVPGLLPTASGPVLAIAAGGLAGLVWLRPSLPQIAGHEALAVPVGKATASA